jgi:DNA-directed RNA polymerase subunit RPC12/RpoP
MSDTKIVNCVTCGKEIEVTKFASPKTAKCENCKKAKAVAMHSAPAMVTPHTEDTDVVKDTKLLCCIVCGKEFEATKFASPKTAKCEECKGKIRHKSTPKVNIDMTKLDRNYVPALKDYKPIPQLVNNSALRHVRCPACGYEYMKMLTVLDYSDRGLIIHYQCTSCMLYVALSEQPRGIVKYHEQGTVYDYSGEACKDLISPLNQSRMANQIDKLLELLESNNIKVEGIELPPYINAKDRPVPYGYRIPKGEVTIKAIDDAIKIINKLGSAKQSKEVNDVVKSLQNLFITGEIAD